MAAPLIDYSLVSTWETLYDLDAEPELGPVYRPHVRLHYHRAVLMRLARENAQAYVKVLGWKATQKIALFGCGFGWTVEALQTDHGFTQVVGCDPSSYIQANKGATEEADVNAAITAAGISLASEDGVAVKGKLLDGGNRSRIAVLNEDGRTAPSRNRIKLALGGADFDIAATEGVLESYMDQDCQAISAALHKLAPTVHHVVVTLRDGSFVALNWKTLEEWTALLPADTFLETGTYRVL